MDCNFSFLWSRRSNYRLSSCPGRAAPRTATTVAIFLSCVSLAAQLYPILCNPMDCSPPGSSVHRIRQVRILEWVAMPFYKECSWPWNRTVSPALQVYLLPETPGKLKLSLGISRVVTVLILKKSQYLCTYDFFYLRRKYEVYMLLIFKSKLYLLWVAWIICSLPNTIGLPRWLSGKESACQAGDLGSVLGSERSSGEEMSTHFNILAWKIPWTEEHGGWECKGWQRVRHN